MTLVLIIGTMCSYACVASAAKTVTTTIKNFSSSTTLNAEQYGAIREGTYTSYKDSNGVWWYKFTRNNQIVIVKASAFSASVGNNLTNVNNALTKGITRKDTVSTSYAYAYKTRTTSYNKTTKTNSYSINIAWLNFSSLRDGKNIDLECNRCSNVCFTYSDKIPIYYNKVKKNGKTTLVKCKTGELGSVMKMEKPSTAAEYKTALKRDTSYNKKITPVFTLEVSQPGSNRVYLSTAEFAGRGLSGSNKTNIAECIDIAYSIGSVAAGIVKKGSLSVGNLYSMFKVIYKVEEIQKNKNSSVDYACDDKIKLSNDNVKSNKKICTLKADFESPIKLKNYNDYFRVTVQLTNNPSYSGTKTILKASVKTVNVK